MLSTEGHPTHVQPHLVPLDSAGDIFAVRQVWNQAEGMVRVLCGSPICVLCKSTQKSVPSVSALGPGTKHAEIVL